jgi:hypothetical protein
MSNVWLKRKRRQRASGINHPHNVMICTVDTLQTQVFPSIKNTMTL